MRRRKGDQPIRILLVEDSRSQRELLASILTSGGFQVAGAVADGQSAIDAVQRLRPDVIAMDIHLPVLDGYEATRRIMQSCPTPIVMVSGSSGDAGTRSLRALEAGALAVVQKPGAPSHPDHTRDRAEMLTMLRLMADVPVVTRFPQRPAAPEFQAPRAVRVATPQLLAVAASTGGPVAVQKLLRGLGPGFPLPVLLVQHIARGFVAPLVEWLGTTVPLPLRIAKGDEPLRRGVVYLAAEGHHLLSAPGARLALRPQRADDRFCPSADELFASVAQTLGPEGIGVILTGMGDDGARGLRTLRDAGSHTIGQDRASCVVYGMPHAAALAGGVAQVEPLERIAPAVLRLVGEGR
jgi:two-component system chemotaxis response regulator CheB